jgi:hypothetical protein
MYNPYFGFSGSPFENTLDQRFLFLGEEHQEVLASLCYFIETQKGFVAFRPRLATGLLSHSGYYSITALKYVSISPQ